MAKKNTQSALSGSASPKQADWTVKIARAMEARQGAQKAREGKPVAFPTNSRLARP
jgi:hypothetical protein